MTPPNPLLTITWGSVETIYRELRNAPVSHVTLAPDYIPLGAFSGGWVTELWTKKAQAKTAMALKVKKFKELVDSGVPINQAAEATHETIKSLLKKTREDYGREVQDTLEAYGWLPPDVKREYIRAKQMEIMDKALAAVRADPTDTKMLKIALDATKLVGDDKDIGLYQVKPGADVGLLSISPVLAALIGDGEETK